MEVSEYFISKEKSRKKKGEREIRRKRKMEERKE